MVAFKNLKSNLDKNNLNLDNSGTPSNHKNIKIREEETPQSQNQ
jgi:hypothetical protein